MSLLAALNLDLEVPMVPASTFQWRVELLKIPAHGNHYEPLVGLMEDGGSPHGAEPGSLAGDGFTDWMTERVDFTSFLPVSMDSSLAAPPAPDLETMATLLKKELEQMEDYFLEDTLSPALPHDQVAPSTPPSHEAHFHFTVPEPVGGRVGEFQTFVPDAASSASAALENLDSGNLELFNLYCDGPWEYPREDLQNLSGISSTADPPAQSKRGSRPTPYERPSNVTLGGPADPPPQKNDRKQKKRDQNKTAALRYRQRKRAEYDALDEECQILEVRNRELKEKSDSIEREIQYVKDLLIEVYKARSQRLRNT